MHVFGCLFVFVSPLMLRHFSWQSASVHSFHMPKPSRPCPRSAADAGGIMLRADRWAVEIFNCITVGWLGSRVVSVLDSGAVGPGFKSQSRCCRVTVSEIGSSPLEGCEGNCSACLTESNGSLLLGLWLTSPAGWLLRNPMLGNRVRSSFTFTFITVGNHVVVNRTGLWLG